MTKLSEDLVCDLAALLTEPCDESAERFWRRWQEFKSTYPISVSAMPPLMKRLFDAVDSVGNEVGWEETYYCNREDWDPEFAKLMEKERKNEKSDQQSPGGAPDLSEVVSGMAISAEAIDAGFQLVCDY